MYGEFLHLDADKAARIQRLDGPYRLYEELAVRWYVQMLDAGIGEVPQ